MLTYDGIVFSLQRAGGISVLFTEILRRLAASEYELVGYSESPPADLPISAYRFNAPRAFERYRRAQVGSACSLFHSTYYRLPANDRCQVVTTVHDFVYERFASPLRRAVHARQKHEAIAGSDRVICVSEFTRRELLRFSGSSLADRTVVIHNGVSDQYRPLANIEILPQVVFVGNRAGYKNFAAVVDALEGMLDISLVCVGGGSFTRAELQVLKRRIPGRYRSAGYLTAEALNLEYNRSLCLVYPSLYEGFGIPLLEAMRAGCPAIAVGTSSIPEVAGDAALLLERGDGDDLRHAIQRVMGRETRDDLVRRGKRQALQFSWQETFERTVAVYEEMLGRKLGRS